MLAKLSLFALLILSCLHCTASIITEGGNITCINLTQPTPTLYWSGIAGWMNTSVSPDLSLPVLIHFSYNASIYTVYANGSVSNYTLLSTLLSSKPDISSLSSPTASDFNSTGMFSNFSLFAGKDFTTFLDSPSNTFANPFATLPCIVGNASFSCAYVFLAQNSFLGVLKYSDATHSEPVFLSSIEPREGYNGSMFDFQFILPANETYFFYIYEEEEINATLYSPISTTYPVSTILVNYSASPDSALDSCWYSLNGADSALPNCTGEFYLTLPDGTYTLVFYANSTTGSVASDSATFTISTAREEGGTDLEDEELPMEPFPGYEFPEVFPGADFTISPGEITIYAIYLSPTESNFTVSSSVALSELACVIEADFIEYVSISLESREIEENGTVAGHIRVNMPLPAILEYGEAGITFADSFYCTGVLADNATRIASARSPVALEAVPPEAEINVSNETDVFLLEDRILINLSITNSMNTSLHNLTINATGPEGLQIILPHFIGELPPGGSRAVPVYVVMGKDVTLPGTVELEFVLSEDGFPLDVNLLELELKAPQLPSPPPGFAPQVCSFPILPPLYLLPETPPQWVFLAIMALATWSLLHRFKGLSRKKRLAIPLVPLALALPGQWIFNPCMMMNLAVAEFAFLALCDAAMTIRRRLWLRKKGKEILEKAQKGEEGKKENAKGQERGEKEAPKEKVERGEQQGKASPKEEENEKGNGATL